MRKHEAKQEKTQHILKNERRESAAPNHIFRNKVEFKAFLYEGKLMNFITHKPTLKEWLKNYLNRKEIIQGILEHQKENDRKSKNMGTTMHVFSPHVILLNMALIVMGKYWRNLNVCLGQWSNKLYTVEYSRAIKNCEQVEN